MKRLFLFLFLVPILGWGKIYYAKVEPYDSVLLKSSVSGRVLEADINAEGRLISKKQVIHIDDLLDKANLQATKESIVLFEKMLEINREIASSLSEMVERQQEHYKRISKIVTASKTQKDSAYNAYVSAKTQYLGTQEKIASLKKQLLDTRYKLAMLEDTIKKKSVVLYRKYLYKLMVKEGDFITRGTPLARIDDTSRAKLVFYLESEEVENIKEKQVYLNDTKTDYHVNKVWRVADEKYISSYRAEIYIDAPKQHFSQLIKIEIK
ncbi:MAG: HlyD family efflux transporter periplasmic adaptor subunit [Sulfurovum sp.]|nr:HlyD family efflux transporter periplasmic adaptor subunit [Sulfurovum sp.]